jgi:hypothetical protein
MLLESSANGLKERYVTNHVCSSGEDLIEVI